MKALSRIFFMKPGGLLALMLLAAVLGPGEIRGEQAPRGEAASAAARVLRLDSIRITGNKRTPDGIILRHLELSPGDEVTADAIEMDRRRLLATDYFSEVDISTRPGAERGTVVLVIDVKEHGYPTFETGFGFHDVHGWFLTLGGLRFDNPFGYESRLRVGARLGFRLAGVDLQWNKPLSAGGRFALAVELHSYGMQHRFFGSGPGAVGDTPWSGTDWRRFQQNIQRTGAEVALDYHSSRSTKFSFGVKAEYVNPDSTFTDYEKDNEFSFDRLPGEFQEGVDDVTLTGVFLRAVRDTRDNPAFPRAGTFSLLTLDVNNTLLGGDEIFTRAKGDFRAHYDVGNAWVLSGRLNAGITTRGTPYYDRFYLGGIYSIRGFEEWSLSQTGGDDGFWLASLELRWPLAGKVRKQAPSAPPRLSGLVFFDTGQGWRRGEKFSTSGVESAAGYGVRLRLPWLGTLGFDVGIPVSNGRTDDPFRMHGSLGFSF